MKFRRTNQVGKFGIFETQTHCFAENCTCSDVGPEARQQNYNCFTSYRDDLENEPLMKVANRANFRPMDKKRQEMGREERTKKVHALNSKV